LKNELGKLSIDIWLTNAERIIDKEVDNTDKDARDIQFKLLLEEKKELKYKNDELVDREYFLENELKNYVDYDETKRLLSIKENNENELRKSLGAPDDKNDQYSLFMWIKTIFDAMINKIRELQNENKKLKNENEQLHKELKNENNSFITYKR
jgi:cell division protein FtsB